MGAPPPESLVPGGPADSAGFAWEGRTFEHHGTEFADDSGETPDGYLETVAKIRKFAKKLALAETAQDQMTALEELALAQAEAVAFAGSCRLLVPLIAQAGDYGLTPEGKVVEKSQELSIVQVAAPDGRSVLPVFTSAETMQSWNPLARPIPVPGVQVAVAAAQENCDLVLINAGSWDSELVVRRPALEAMALKKQHLPSWANPEVVAAFEDSMKKTADVFVRGHALAPGDPLANLSGPELTVGLQVKAGLSREDLKEIASRHSDAFSRNPLIAERVDSLKITFF